jgi:hypothetical protein
MVEGACFDDLPIDVVWLILKRYIQSRYVMRHTGDIYFANGNMSRVIIPLSRISKRIRRLLKSKSCFDDYHWTWWFITGAFFDIDGKPTF